MMFAYYIGRTSTGRERYQRITHGSGLKVCIIYQYFESFHTVQSQDTGIAKESAPELISHHSPPVLRGDENGSMDITSEASSVPFEEDEESLRGIVTVGAAACAAGAARM